MSHTPYPPGPDPYRAGPQHGDPYRGGQYPAPAYGGYGAPAPVPGSPGRIPVPPARTLSAGTVVAAALSVALLWGLVLLVAHAGLNTVTGQALDETALQQAKADRNTFFPSFVLVAAQFLPEVVAVLAGALALVWAVRYRRWVAAP